MVLGQLVGLLAPPPPLGGWRACHPTSLWLLFILAILPLQSGCKAKRTPPLPSPCSTKVLTPGPLTPLADNLPHVAGIAAVCGPATVSVDDFEVEVSAQLAGSGALEAVPVRFSLEVGGEYQTSGWATTNHQGQVALTLREINRSGSGKIIAEVLTVPHSSRIIASSARPVSVSPGGPTTLRIWTEPPVGLVGQVLTLKAEVTDRAGTALHHQVKFTTDSPQAALMAGKEGQPTTVSCSRPGSYQIIGQVADLSESVRVLIKSSSGSSRAQESGSASLPPGTLVGRVCRDDRDCGGGRSCTTDDGGRRACRDCVSCRCRNREQAFSSGTPLLSYCLSSGCYAEPGFLLLIPPTSRSCHTSGQCSYDGSCVARGNSCVAVSDDDCARSTLCREQAKCTARNGVCVATSDDHCQKTATCKKDGRCKARGGECVYSTAEACQRSRGCTICGRCSLRGASCIAASTGDCRESATCKLRGSCTAHKGECVADVPRHQRPALEGGTRSAPRSP